jgi:hypothetical protein
MSAQHYATSSNSMPCAKPCGAPTPPWSRTRSTTRRSTCAPSLAQAPSGDSELTYSRAS